MGLEARKKLLLHLRTKKAIWNEPRLPSFSLLLIFQCLGSDSFPVPADTVEQNSCMGAVLRSVKLITIHMLTAKCKLKCSCLLNHFGGFYFVQGA